jgi:phage-related baseplate assembly protein
MTVQSHLDDPEHWRDRAEQVRALADQVTGQKAKIEILRIAAEYALLAKRAEERIKRPPS